MSEKNLRHKVREILKPGHIIQVENAVCPGTPDTYASFTFVPAPVEYPSLSKSWRGWIELKYAENIPARASTAVFKSLNRGLDVEQEAWAFRGWQSSPGSTWILAQIGKLFYLVPGNKAYTFNEYTLAEFAAYQITLVELKFRLVQG